MQRRGEPPPGGSHHRAACRTARAGLEGVDGVFEATARPAGPAESPTPRAIPRPRDGRG